MPGAQKRCCSRGKGRQVTHPQQRSNAMRLQPRARAVPGAHRTSARVATDVCRARSDVARPLDALKVHQVFLRGRKNVVVQGEKRGRQRTHSNVPTRCGTAASPRPLGLRRTAHVRSDAASAASKSSRFIAPTLTLSRTAHLKSCCPSAEHARDPRKRAMPETPV